MRGLEFESPDSFSFAIISAESVRMRLLYQNSFCILNFRNLKFN